MNTLSTRTKLLFSVAIVLFGLFLFAESERGERFVTGQPSEDSQAEEEEFDLGLHSLIYCAVPSGVLLLLSLVSYKADRRRVG